MTDLVVISLERWDDVWRRNQHLVHGLLRSDPTMRVLFVEPPDDPLHAVRSGARPTFGRGLRRHRRIRGLWSFRPVKWLPRRVDSGADRRLAESALRTAKSLGMTDPILWINDPGASSLSALTGWPTLYDITDDWLAADQPAGELARLTESERFLLDRADEVVACSREIVRRKEPYRGSGKHPISLVPNAVDVAAYQNPRPRPDDLPPGYVALYAGTIHADRFDVELTVATARVLRETGIVVLVGPNLLGDKATRDLLTAGVSILGPRDRDDLVGYLQHADVLIVPHVVTPFTDSLDPIKLYEYQAAGRPVVATPVAGFRDAEGSITIEDGAGFATRVASVATGEVPRSSNSETPSADWSTRVASVKEILDRMTAQRGS